MHIENWRKNIILMCTRDQTKSTSKKLVRLTTHWKILKSEWSTTIRSSSELNSVHLKVMMSQTFLIKPKKLPKCGKSKILNSKRHSKKWTPKNYSTNSWVGPWGPTPKTSRSRSCSQTGSVKCQSEIRLATNSSWSIGTDWQWKIRCGTLSNSILSGSRMQKRAVPTWEIWSMPS